MDKLKISIQLPGKEKEKEKEKTFEKFDKKLKSKINSASTARSWSDLLPIMKDIFSILTRNNDYDFNNISDKRFTSARNNKINQLIFSEHCCNFITCLDLLRCISRHLHVSKGLPHDLCKNLVCFQSFAAAFQKNSISAFNTQ